MTTQKCCPSRGSQSPRWCPKPTPKRLYKPWTQVNKLCETISKDQIDEYYAETFPAPSLFDRGPDRYKARLSPV